MNEKCDHCDRLATVHETTTESGNQTHRDLCEFHAQQSGLKPIMAQVCHDYANKHSLPELKSFVSLKVSKFAHEKLVRLGLTREQLSNRIDAANSVDDVIRALGAT